MHPDQRGGPRVHVTEDNLARFPDEVREQVRERTPSGRLSVPEDVAAAVVFLSSPANTNITGSSTVAALHAGRLRAAPTSQVTISGWSTDVERSVKWPFCLVDGWLWAGE
jgi:NAD(P)-dependent dehydrogenase (short-subunit alcohol dehydrogenase family)